MGRLRKGEKAEKTNKGDIALVCGYGLYQAVSSSGYLTAMGTVSSNLGFVSQLPFMMVGCVFGALAAFACAGVARRGRFALGTAVLAAAYALIALCPLVSGACQAAGVGDLALSSLLGGIRGLCTSAISLIWVCLFVLYARGNIALLYVLTFALKGGLGLAFDALPVSLASTPASLALLAASLACAFAVHACGDRADASPAVSPATAIARWDARLRFEGYRRTLVQPHTPHGRAFYASWLCLLVCEFVVGVANTAVFNSSFSTALEGVNMNACTLASAAVVGALAALTRRTPEPSQVFKGCMPVLLAVFSLMPFVTDQLGPVAGYAMIVCYDALAVAFSIYLVALLRDKRYHPGLNAGVFMGVSNLTLLLGLAVGLGMNMLWSSRGVPLLTLLAFVAIYPIGIALLLVQRSRGQGATGDQGEKDPAGGAPADAPGRAGGPAETFSPATSEQVGELMRDYYENRLAEFARTYGLTPRESQVCSHLVRGRSVKFVYQELSITENTAWTHIKNLYTKCGVGTKQELMDLFEKDA